MGKDYLDEVLKDIPEKCLEKLKALLDVLIMDPLLNIPNRFYFKKFINKDLKLAQRFGVPLSILFIDADNLKAINDSFGHKAGDEYLKHIVKVLKKNLRESDTIIRWGGDEFLVVLHTDERGANVVKRRILEDFRRNSFKFGGKEIPVSVSIGVAEVKDDIESAIQEADKKMYEEKKEKK